MNSGEFLGSMSPPASFYEFQLIVLILFCLFLLLVERQILSRSRRDDKTDSEEGDINSPTSIVGTNAVRSKLTKQYLIVYAIVMGADWLQGPYIYSLYREEYAFPERLVAGLFVTGFTSAGLAAPLIGVWADQYGRRRLCLTFCIGYTLACTIIQFPYLPALFVGRFLGGFSTSILYSAFESWLVSTANSLALPQSDLSSIMGHASLVNGFVAAAAGVASNQLVTYTGTYSSPFIVSGILCVVAWITIRGTWTENYGIGGGATAVTSSDPLQLRRLGQAWKVVRGEPPLLVIGLTQTCFEGSMYLFVFNWVPALQEASLSKADLPLGYVFSSFMISMMIGSLLYTCIVSVFLRPGPAIGLGIAPATSDTPLALHAKLSALVCAASAVALAASIESSDEHIRFWSFCTFEVCVGMYYPVQGMLRGTLISNEHRATLASLFRVPLNIFVVVSLLTGVSSARYAVLTTSSLMLVFSSLMTTAFLIERR